MRRPRALGAAVAGVAALAAAALGGSLLAPAQGGGSAALVLALPSADDVREAPAGEESRRVLLGAWSAPVSGLRTWQSREASFGALEQALGERLAIEHIFASFEERPFDERAIRAASRGRLPLISWNDPVPARVLDGGEDAYLRAVARDFARDGRRVLLRFGWEMDRPRNEATDPVAFRALWRHVHAVFEDEGATAVEWVWCPTNWAFAPRSRRDPLAWYPGDDVVDWLCADGYSFYPEKPAWVPFEEAFGRFYDWARGRGKPIVIAETGVMEDPRDPGRKGEWYRELADTVRCRFTEIDAVVLFDEEKHEQGVVRDWRIGSSAASIAGARDMAASSVFGGSADERRCPNAW